MGNQLFTFDAQEAVTPYIKSQTISGDRYDLFQVETIGAGNTANTKVKIGISNIKAAGSVNGTDYGTFTLVVRTYSDTNKKKVVLDIVPEPQPNIFQKKKRIVQQPLKTYFNEDINIWITRIW